MADKVKFDIQGLEDVEKRVNSLLSSVLAEDVEKILVGGAQIIRDEAKTRAQSLYKKKTGNLFKSFRAKKLKRKHRTFAAAMAAVDRKKAPHGHLLERGHRIFIRGKYIGKSTQGRPFFEPAIEAKRAEVGRFVTDGLAKLIKGAW